MKYKGAADYLEFLEDLQQQGFVAMVDEAVKSKEQWDIFIKMLLLHCKKQRRKHILHLTETMSVEMISNVTGWSLSLIHECMKKRR